LKHFPFFKDALVIRACLTNFITAFINSYYSTDDKPTKDNELQAWIAEAVPAEVIDFPSVPLTERRTLIDILTHLAYLAIAVHHTLNDLAEYLATLPFHPASLYSLVPTTKNITSIPWLPGPVPAIGKISLTAFFNRVMFAHISQTLAYLFDDLDALARMNEETGKAAQDFRHAMNK
jgi:arachidonate 15-lipoxygenase (second type) / 8-lipoxygenase (S-type)